MRKLCLLALVAGMVTAQESQACGLLRSLFGGCRGNSRPVVSQSTCGTCQPASTPVTLPANVNIMPTIQPSGFVTSPSCPNGNCPRQSVVPSGFRLSGNIGPISGGVSILGIRDIIGLHNAERVARGLPALTEDPQLSAAAQAQANAQANSGRMFHASRLAGRAENVAAGQSTDAEVARDWMNSPGHRANILNGSFTQIGIGRAGNYWAVQFK